MNSSKGRYEEEELLCSSSWSPIRRDSESGIGLIGRATSRSENRPIYRRNGHQFIFAFFCFSPVDSVVNLSKRSDVRIEFDCDRRNKHAIKALSCWNPYHFSHSNSIDRRHLPGH